MAKHIETGKKGESRAVQFLLANGYDILHKNWRCGHWEVDVIASKGGVLHFIEVKTKRNNRSGFPEEAVTRRKINFLIGAAEFYLFQHPTWQRMQIDIVAIVMEPMMEIFLIEDVYLN